MSQDNAYKNYLLMKPEVRDQGKKDNSVSVKVIELLKSNRQKMNCFSLILIETLKLIFLPKKV